MQKTSRFSRLLTLVTAVALAVCLPVSAYAETETTEEAAAPAVVEEAAQETPLTKLQAKTALPVCAWWMLPFLWTPPRAISRAIPTMLP